MAFEIRIDRLSYTHSLSFEKKAEVVVYCGSYVANTFLQIRGYPKYAKQISCFEGTCLVFKAVASSMWTASQMSDPLLRLLFHCGLSQIESAHMLTKSRISSYVD